MKSLSKILILGSILLGLSATAAAQQASLRYDPNWVKHLPPSVEFKLTFLGVPKTPSQPKQMTIPQAWCYSDLAFFCKIEVKMEKAARFPVKFRLGDVQYVDMLEGKRY